MILAKELFTVCNHKGTQMEYGLVQGALLGRLGHREHSFSVFGVFLLLLHFPFSQTGWGWAGALEWV